MVLKKRALKVAVDLAVEAACRRVGVHGVCPIAVDLVRGLAERERGDDRSKRRVGAGDRARVPVRPEEKRDRLTRLVEEEIQRSFPDLIAIPPVHRRGLARAVGQGMVRHVQGQVVGAGGRTVKDIITRLTAPGVNAPRREERGTRRGSQFEPGTDPP